MKYKIHFSNIKLARFFILLKEILGVRQNGMEDGQMNQKNGNQYLKLKKKQLDLL
jgi:hypothetical protein